MKLLKILIIFSVVLLLAVYFGGCKSTAFTSAKLYLQQENYSKAVEFLQLEVSQNPKNAEAYYWLGYCHARDSKFEEMNSAFNSSLGISNQFATDISNVRKKYWIDNFNNGVRKLQNNQLQESIADFQVAIIIDPNAADAYKDLGFAYVRLDSHHVAVDMYKKALELDAKDTKTLLTLGVEYYSTQKYQDAIDIMQKLLVIDPENKEAISYTALSYDLLGERDKALAAYDNALQKNPNDPDLYFNRGRLYYMRDDYDNAAADFTRVTELNPTDFEAVYNLGNAYLSIGEKFLKERSDLEKQEGDINKIAALKNKEKTYFESAKTYLEKARDLKPDHVNAWNNLGIAYVKLGMIEEGKAAFKKVTELEKK